MTPMSVLRVSDFKARCLAVLDEVARTGERVVLLRRGKPIAQISPAVGGEEKEYPQHRLRGTLEIVGDVMEPPLPPEAWEAERGRRP
jgi:antitoxin (DNA-binding transcriptional repressor) of toxin-antitoxin stability system